MEKKKEKKSLQNASAAKLSFLFLSLPSTSDEDATSDEDDRLSLILSSRAQKSVHPRKTCFGYSIMGQLDLLDSV